MSQKLEASFSTLILSIGSSAAIAMGLAPDPNTGKTHSDKDVAKFNIDMLMILEEKTKNNLNEEERQFLSRIITDLQIKFVELNKK